VSRVMASFRPHVVIHTAGQWAGRALGGGDDDDGDEWSWGHHHGGGGGSDDDHEAEHDAEVIPLVCWLLFLFLAAMSSPAGCEKAPEVALAINAPTPLVDALTAGGLEDALIVFLSTASDLLDLFEDLCGKGEHIMYFRRPIQCKSNHSDLCGKGEHTRVSPSFHPQP
jgi:hypothetical protein